jgi:hypothetical protein
MTLERTALEVADTNKTKPESILEPVTPVSRLSDQNLFTSHPAPPHQTTHQLHKRPSAHRLSKGDVLASIFRNPSSSRDRKNRKPIKIDNHETGSHHAGAPATKASRKTLFTGCFSIRKRK